MKARTEALNVSQELCPGDVIAGKYRVEQVLGQGGMGIVLAARHLQLDQRVAIKMLLPHSLRNPELVARFDQEARATVRIQSEHVVKVLDVGQERGSPYMVMEYLEGQDLAVTLKQRGPLPLGDAVGYVLQACEALAEAHKQGIVHRDLKPANLFLTTRADGSPLVKVLDFGISKATLATGLGPSGGLTMDATIMGSPNYMSPEQLKNSKDVDVRADIWSLGLVLYELLTGAVAFRAETLAELHVAILQSFPHPLSTARPDMPPNLEMVVLRCLQKDRNFRYPNVGELAQALADFAPAAAQVSVERTARLMGLPPRSQPSASASGWAAPGNVSGWAPPTVPSAQAVNGYAQSGASWSQPLPQPAMPLVPPAHLATPAPQLAPIWVGPPQQSQEIRRSGPPTAIIVMAVIVGVIVLSGVGCTACVLFLGALLRLPGDRALLDVLQAGEHLVVGNPHRQTQGDKNLSLAIEPEGAVRMEHLGPQAQREHAEGVGGETAEDGVEPRVKPFHLEGLLTGLDLDVHIPLASSAIGPRDDEMSQRVKFRIPKHATRRGDEERNLRQTRQNVALDIARGRAALVVFALYPQHVRL